MEQKVAFIFSNVVGTVTRADLVHKSNGDVSRGFYAVHQFVHSCLRGRKPGRVPWCHRFPNAHSPPRANTLNRRRTRFSRKTLLHQDLFVLKTEERGM